MENKEIKKKWYDTPKFHVFCFIVGFFSMIWTVAEIHNIINGNFDFFIGLDLGINILLFVLVIFYELFSLIDFLKKRKKGSDK
ncbi:hypothetical protein [Spiroplasma endosymbiont of Lasioglossum malachurum]|uniref:hypothetical protein n=1 Tax=Spiroplasma endosymbiont of Lasioglossum malachurum TaxID=3066319 RepID=UPI0030CAFB73